MLVFPPDFPARSLRFEQRDERRFVLVVVRTILAGIPPAVALKASGHTSDEWKRYLNMTPDQLQKLFNPLEGQVVEDVKRYGLDVLQQLREALGYTDIANLIASLESRH